MAKDKDDNDDNLALALNPNDPLPRLGKECHNLSKWRKVRFSFTSLCLANLSFHYHPCLETFD
jgi:hypothetical protein